MLDRESACNRVFSGPSLCSVRRRWSWASVRARSFVFKLAAAPRIDNVVTAALLPHQPDQLRCRHDRHDNGERATPLYVPRRNGTKRKFFNDFSRVACAGARKAGRVRRPLAERLYSVWVLACRLFNLDMITPSYIV